jgi:ornithine cyclodeaminase/alanine dehydrogenase-like protein (mu-crystallin family)
MALLIKEDQVAELLDIETAILAVEQVLRDQAEGAATNRPRQRVAAPNSQLHVMAGGDRRLGVYGIKVYTASRQGARFLVLLYESEGGQLLAIIEADKLGQMRTGAASGVATKFMARQDADSVGIFGAGWQAESQLIAVSTVRPIKSIKVYSRNPERRRDFANRMSAILGVEVMPAKAPQEAARQSSIIITATTSAEPVLEGNWVEAGAHVNAIGSNFLHKREVDLELIRRADVIAVDSIEQAKLESGDLLPAIERGVIAWEGVIELGRVVAGQIKGRAKQEDITLFESHGIALWDVAVALRVYQKAKERGLGQQIELWGD